MKGPSLQHLREEGIRIATHQNIADARVSKYSLGEVSKSCARA